MSHERTHRSTISCSEDENREDTSVVQTARLEDTNKKLTTDEILNISNKNFYYLQTSTKKQNNNNNLQGSTLARKNRKAIQRPGTSNKFNHIRANEILIECQR